jgi:hypothetical protein
MKRYIRSSSAEFTTLAEAKQIIDSINMTEGRRKALYDIQEWNVSPDDVARLAGKYSSGAMRFTGSVPVVSVSYGESDKVDTAFILEYEDGTRRMYGWKRSSIDPQIDDGVFCYWAYVKRV